MFNSLTLPSPPNCYILYISYILYPNCYILYIYIYKSCQFPVPKISQTFLCLTISAHYLSLSIHLNLWYNHIHFIFPFLLIHSPQSNFLEKQNLICHWMPNTYQWLPFALRIKTKILSGTYNALPKSVLNLILFSPLSISHTAFFQFFECALTSGDFAHPILSA